MRTTERFALPLVAQLPTKAAVILCATLCAVFATQPATGQSATEGVQLDKPKHTSTLTGNEALERDGREGLVYWQTCYYCDHLDDEPPLGSGMPWDSVGAYEGCHDDASEQESIELDDCSIIHEGDWDSYSACSENAQSSYDSAVAECDSM